TDRVGRSTSAANSSRTPPRFQSTSSALSWLSQYSATSASLARFLRFVMDRSLSSTHGTRRDDTHPAPADRECHEQPASPVRGPEPDISLLTPRVPHVHLTNGIVQQYLFGLADGHSVLQFRLAPVGGVPLEPEESAHHQAHRAGA